MSDPSIFFFLISSKFWSSSSFGSSGGAKNKILLLGLPYSGKTSIVNKLTNTKVKSTFTSQRIYEKPLNLSDENDSSKKSVTSFSMVDVPGHPKLRNEYQLYVSKRRSRTTIVPGRVKAILFVIDSMTFKDQLTEISSFLLNIIPSIMKVKSIYLIICCHKCDELLAYPKDKIKNELEQEIQKYQDTTYTLDRHDDDNNVSRSNTDDAQEEVLAFLQTLGEKFTFDILSEFIPVEFLETSIQDEDEDELKTHLVENFFS